MMRWNDAWSSLGLGWRDHRERREAVRLAARVLDRQLDRAWWLDVSTSNLDMAAAKGCVLGQLVGDFFNGSARVIRDHALRNGVPRRAFNPYEARTITIRWENALLTRCWVREIERRRRVGRRAADAVLRRRVEREARESRESREAALPATHVGA